MFLSYRHSQNTEVPACPAGTRFLWNGYSLLNFHANARASGQDLGSSGSCVQRFSTAPVIHCTTNEVCSYAINQDNSYWLSTSQPMTPDMKPLTGLSIKPYISRCSVCESIGTVS